ncbi:MAG: macro domain-containing protein [candidate division WOR-3 bacterium]|nr:MAG: macro domain-containing protein [candidate division WOR-3 bacterium]
MQKMIKGVTVEITQGNIAAQQAIDAIVNAANAQLQTGGGVAGAIHSAAGPDLTIACRTLAPIKPGEAVITGAYKLPNKYVVHCLGPVYGHDEPAAVLLANCYRNSLTVAEQNKAHSVAFPAISTGAFGYPLEEAAEIALRTVLESLSGLRYVRHVRFVLYTDEQREVFEKFLMLLLAEASKL